MIEINDPGGSMFRKANGNINNNNYRPLSLLDDPLNDPVQGVLRPNTHLIQVYTSNPDEGPRLISDYNPHGVPIMIVIKPPSCCYYKLNIPHGIVSLE
jgi:hypothetical protein